jgi:hypothetical protein
MGSKNKKGITIESKEVFQRINDKFVEYWTYLFRLIAFYILGYGLWNRLISGEIRRMLDNRGFNEKKSKSSFPLFLALVIIQGLLFCLDGWVTALLKSPFNQMCYAINKAEGVIREKERDQIITIATESNEHCKETLKKFGVVTISIELLKVFSQAKNLRKSNLEQFGQYADWIYVSYLIPLAWAAFDIWKIHRTLRKIEKRMKALEK